MPEHMQLTPDEERSILARAKTEPRQAFEALYRSYVDRIYGFLMKRMGDASRAEDLTAKVFLRAYEALPRYEDRGLPYGSYLFRIAARELVSDWRAEKGGTEELKEEHAVTEAGDARLDSKLAFARVSAALPSLPDSYRSVIDLKYFGELSNEEIARVLGWTANKVGVTLHRAKIALTEHLA